MRPSAWSRLAAVAFVALMLPGCLDPWESRLYDCHGSSWIGEGTVQGLYDAIPDLPSEHALPPGRGDDSAYWTQGDYRYGWVRPGEPTFPRSEPVPEAWAFDRLAGFRWRSPLDDGDRVPDGFFVGYGHGTASLLASYPADTSQDQMMEDLDVFLAAATDLSASERATYGGPGGPEVRRSSGGSVPDDRFGQASAADRATWIIDLDGDRVRAWDLAVAAGRDARPGTDLIEDGPWTFEVAAHGQEILYRADDPGGTVEIYVSSLDRASILARGGPRNEAEMLRMVGRVLDDHGTSLEASSLEMQFRPDQGCSFDSDGPDT